MSDQTLDSEIIKWQPISTVSRDDLKRILLAKFESDQITAIDLGCWEFIEYSDFDGSPVYDWQTVNGSDLDWTHWAEYD